MDYQTRAEIEALIDAAGQGYTGGKPSDLGRAMHLREETCRQRVNNWLAAGKMPIMVARAYATLFKRLMRGAEKARAGRERADRARAAPAARAARKRSGAKSSGAKPNAAA